MKDKKNYIDHIPKINDMKWEVLEDGIVEITVENKGFYNTIAQKIAFKRPRYSFIKLDEYGSFCVAEDRWKEKYLRDRERT